MGKLTNEVSAMLSRTTSRDFGNVTFLQALEAGHTHSGWLVGPTTGQSGREAALASHSVPPARAAVLTTSGTFGPLFGGSSPSVGLQSSLASRLHRRLAGIGSPEYALTWKRWDMRSGPPICALRASALPTSASGSSGWRTPATTEPGVSIERLQTKDGEPWTPGERAYDKLTGRVCQVGLTHEARASLTGWPTPNALPEGRGGLQGNPDAALRRRANGHMLNLDDAATLAGWPTPNAPNGGRSMDPEKMDATGKTLDGRKHAAQLEHAVRFAGWQTPKLPSGGGVTERTTPGGGLRKLEDQVLMLAGWTTPQAHDPTARGKGQKAKHGTKHGCADLNADAQLAGEDCWKSRRTMNQRRDEPEDEPEDTTTLAAGWTTPQATEPDTEGYRPSREATGRTTDYLGRQCKLTSGPTASSLPAGTGRRGGCQRPTGKLNPFFSCWLMGYGVQWVLAGIRGVTKAKRR